MVGAQSRRGAGVFRFCSQETKLQLRGGSVPSEVSGTHVPLQGNLSKSAGLNGEPLPLTPLVSMAGQKSRLGDVC